MFHRVQNALAEQFPRLPKSPLILGVSGGADSLALLDILVRLRYPLVVAHFNHLLRPEASDDALAVKRVAAKMRVPLVLGADDVARHAREFHLSIEEAARELRYRFLFEQAEKHKAAAVLVAHNADDQVETVLMHLLRGAGLDGLTGMTVYALPNPWSETIPLIRPMLGVWRSEINAYCLERSLHPLTDATNADTTFFRNRLRHELIPELETYVPGFRRRLHQTADLLAADRALLDDLTAAAWDKVTAEARGDFVTFNRLDFSQQPLALQRRLIRRAVTCLRPEARDVSFALVHRTLDFIASPTRTRQIDLGLGLRLSIEGETLLLAAWEADLPAADWPQISEAVVLPVPGEAELGSGWVLRAEMLSDGQDALRAARGNRDPYRAWVDLGKRQPSLIVRPRHPGERFQPLGLGGHSLKVSDFMINKKIPQRARSGWPLVTAGDEIVWIPGYQLAHAFRLTEQAGQVILLRLERRTSTPEAT
jgi:tRNA(Ile)-lysidine synthase